MNSTLTLSTKQVAEMLKITPRRVGDLVRRGEIEGVPPVVGDKRRLNYTLASVEAYIKKRKSQEVDKNIFSAQQVAEIFAVNERTVLYWVKQEKIIAQYHHRGKQHILRFSRQAIDEFAIEYEKEVEWELGVDGVSTVAYPL